MLKDQRVLVTGAGGFIGSHLCERLIAHGARVTAMIHYSSRADWGNLEYLSAEMKSALDVVAGDIQDSDFVMRAVKDQAVVFHLAALIAIPYSYVAPRSYVRTNIEGTLNVLEACRRLGAARIIHTSTSEIYGTALYAPIDEKHPTQGQSPYSASKIGADRIVESYFRSFDLPVVTLRPFNTFGPRQSARAVIPTIITQALGSAPEIRLGTLEAKRDLTFVHDTADGFIATANAPAAVLGEEINLGVGKTIRVGDLARQIQALCGVDKPIVLDSQRLRPVNSEVMHLISNNAKAATLLGWAPTVPLVAGLEQTISFVRDHWTTFRQHAYVI
jgi:NAD dependent epimerase/dehydratase